MGGESGSEKVCLVCICVLLPTIFREGKEGREEGQIKKKKGKQRQTEERKKESFDSRNQSSSPDVIVFRDLINMHKETKHTYLRSGTAPLPSLCYSFVSIFPLSHLRSIRIYLYAYLYLVLQLRDAIYGRTGPVCAGSRACLRRAHPHHLILFS